MLFGKKKKKDAIPEEFIEEPVLLPEVSVADLPDTVDIRLDETAEPEPEFPVSDAAEPLNITEAPVPTAETSAAEDGSVSMEKEQTCEIPAETASDEDIPSTDISETDAEAEEADSTEEAEEPEQANEINEAEAEPEADADAALSDFERSLKNFSENDIEPAVKSNEKKRDIMRIFVMIICVGAFIYSTSYLVRNIHDKIESDRIYGDIIDSVADGFAVDESTVVVGGKVNLLAQDSKTAYTPTIDEIIKNGAVAVTPPSDYSAELAKMRASLDSLKKINSDIYGWIKIPGTNINYPIAKTDNNEYYLDHAYTGDNLVNGSIYADFRCVLPITANYNTVLYGHNVTTGSMFNHVSQFFKPEVFENTNIYIYTFDGIYIFKPFSIHEAAYDSGYVDMGFSEEEFLVFANSLKDMSDIKSDVVFTPSDRIITLSTCTNGISTQRYALHGVLIETITE